MSVVRSRKAARRGAFLWSEWPDTTPLGTCMMGKLVMPPALRSRPCTTISPSNAVATLCRDPSALGSILARADARRRRQSDCYQKRVGDSWAGEEQDCRRATKRPSACGGLDQAVAPGTDQAPGNVQERDGGAAAP